MGDFADDYNGVNGYPDLGDDDVNQSLRDSGRYHYDLDFEDREWQHEPKDPYIEFENKRRAEVRKWANSDEF
jgi:hypothetical protein